LFASKAIGDGMNRTNVGGYARPALSPDIPSVLEMGGNSALAEFD
jgi:hypothetical protein